MEPFRVIIFIVYYFVSTTKMDYENMRVVDLKALAKECGLQGYSRLRKAELIAFLRDNLQPSTRPPPMPAPRPPPAMHTRPEGPRIRRPPRPTIPPPPLPPPQAQLVRFDQIDQDSQNCQGN